LRPASYVAPPGRTPIPLFLGIDVGGTKTALALGDGAGKIVAHERLPTPFPDDARRALGVVGERARALVGQAGASLDRVAAGGGGGGGVAGPWRRGGGGGWGREPAEPARLGWRAGSCAPRRGARPADRDRERRQRGGPRRVALRRRPGHAGPGVPHHVHR